MVNPPDLTTLPPHLFVMNNSKKPALGYILKGYPRISETFISNEILRLEQLGFKLTLFSMRLPRENFTHDSVKQIQAEVHYLPTYLGKQFFTLLFPNLLLALKRPRRYGQALAIAFKRFRRTRKSATFKHLLQAGFLVNNHLGKGVEIDHLHGHFAHSPTSVTMFAATLSNMPFSFTAHAKDIYTSNKEQLREKIDNASFVVTCTGFNAEHLRSIAPESTTPIHRIYHGIDTTLFSSSTPQVESKPPYRLLTVARITEKKGLPTIYQALAELKKRNISFQHVLIGDGDDREKTQALIDELDLRSHCQLLGTRTHQEVLQHFSKSDLFILGCQVARNGDRDGIPNVLVESLAMGVPALSTNVSAIPELIIDGATGRTVAPEDSSAMAEAIMELLQNQQLREKVSRSGQEFVKKNFDNLHLTAQLAELFTGYVGRGRKNQNQ